MSSYSDNRSFIGKFFLTCTLFVTVCTGVQADNKRTECPNEQIALECPYLESVLQNGTLLELQWRATDPEDLNLKQYVVYCNKNLQCTRNRNIRSFHERIKVSNAVRGTLLLKQMKLNDRLIYTCIIERRGNKGPIANKIIVTSSKHCLSSKTGQNLDLGKTFRDMFSNKTVEDVEWFRVSQNGKNVKIAYCSSSSPCRLENCISSCPEYLTRLKAEGLSVILSNVTEADRGLEFQCQIHPKIMTKGPGVCNYMIRINEISPREAVDDINRTTFKSNTTAKPAADTTAPTGNNPGPYSIQNSWLIAFSVVISLVMAPYGIS